MTENRWHLAVEHTNSTQTCWVAHALSDAKGLPIDQVLYDLVDLVVVSLRSMPEHCSWMRNWMAMLAALGDCNKITDCSEKRTEAVKQRVVLHMLASAAEMEGMDGMHDAKMACIGQDRLAFEAAEKKRAMVSRTSAKKALAEFNEELTLALLHSLPDILQAFKTDPAVVATLASLPQCFVPSVFNLASRKSEFQLLVANLSESFLNCPDTTVLEKSWMTLSLLQHGDHFRVADVLLQLKNIACTLRDRFVYLLEEKSRLKLLVKSCSDRKTAQVENEIAICLCMRRVLILSQQWYIGELLVEPSSEQFDPEIDSLLKSASENTAKDLKARMTSTESSESAGDIWSTADTKLHGHVASTITESLTFLLAATAWRLSVEIERADVETVEYADNLVGHIVVRMRDTIAFLLHLCFDLFIDDPSGDMTSEQIDFAEAVNWAACDISPDLRSLFPVEWKKCISCGVCLR